MMAAMRGVQVPHLKAWRLARLMTQNELAAKSGVSRGTVINAENGAVINTSNVKKLAAALGIGAQRLLNEEPK